MNELIINSSAFKPYPPVENHTPLTWTIWAILTITLLTFIVLGIVWSIMSYKKNNKPFLTIDKIAIFGTFLSFFIVQAFVTSPLLKLPIPFSIDSITTIAVGFMFGPLEGILFGWVADSLRVLINGWNYQFLPALMYPTIGLIASVFGILYRKYEEIPNWLSMVLFQTVIVTIVLILIPMDYFLVEFGRKQLAGLDDKYLGELMTYQLPMLISSIIMLFALEGIYASFYIFKWDKKDMFLLLILVLTAFADRTMELVIRPFTQYFTGYETIYVVGLYTRILSSSYLIPSVAIASMALIKVSKYSLETIAR